MTDLCHHVCLITGCRGLGKGEVRNNGGEDPSPGCCAQDALTTDAFNHIRDHKLAPPESTFINTVITLTGRKHRQAPIVYGWCTFLQFQVGY